MDDDMPPHARLLHIAGLALSLALIAGCTEDARPPVRNHAPKQAYLITLTVENPPAPVTAIEGYASYQAMNEGDCLPRQPFFGGPAGAGFATEPVQFKPVSANVWQAVVYADLYLDQPQTNDLGVCDWEFIGAGGDFTLGGVTFYADMSQQDVLSQGARTGYYKRSWLTRPSIDGLRLGPEIGTPADVAGMFRARIESKEISP